MGKSKNTDKYGKYRDFRDNKKKGKKNRNRDQIVNQDEKNYE
jgi:hypothetical protein